MEKHIKEQMLKSAAQFGELRVKAQRLEVRVWDPGLCFFVPSGLKFRAVVWSSTLRVLFHFFELFYGQEAKGPVLVTNLYCYKMHQNSCKYKTVRLLFACLLITSTGKGLSLLWIP